MTHFSHQGCWIWDRHQRLSVRVSATHHCVYASVEEQHHPVLFVCIASQERRQARQSTGKQQQRVAQASQCSQHKYTQQQVLAGCQHMPMRQERHTSKHNQFCTRVLYKQELTVSKEVKEKHWLVWASIRKAKLSHQHGTFTLWHKQPTGRSRHLNVNQVHRMQACSSRTWITAVSATKNHESKTPTSCRQYTKHPELPSQQWISANLNATRLFCDCELMCSLNKVTKSPLLTASVSSSWPASYPHLHALGYGSVISFHSAIADLEMCVWYGYSQLLHWAQLINLLVWWRGRAVVQATVGAARGVWHRRLQLLGFTTMARNFPFLETAHLRFSIGTVKYSIPLMALTSVFTSSDMTLKRSWMLPEEILCSLNHPSCCKVKTYTKCQPWFPSCSVLPDRRSRLLWGTRIKSSSGNRRPNYLSVCPIFLEFVWSKCHRT